ncbi:MAG: T9SS type A sorting domain-containing protein [Chlorobi bacterium]|nr:T9SS type A sorting domain-containing protein [Chlorobiota bacterium]
MKRTIIIIPILFSVVISAQSIVGTNPSYGRRSESLTVTISGQNTHFNQATNTIVWFSQGSETVLIPNNTTVTDDTNIDALFTFSSSELLGLYDVNVYSGYDGLLVLENGFLIGSAVSVNTPDDINIRILPNPGKGYINLKSEKIINSVNIFDINGRQVNFFNVNSKQKSLDLSSLAKGVYILKIKTQGNIVTKKIIIN